MTRTVLVTDGEQRAALAIVRALGLSGHVVHVCSVRDRTLSGSSRYCHSESVVPDPLADPAAFASAVRQLMARKRVDALVPVTEPALLSLLPLRDTFPGVLLPFPDLDVFERICDKALVLDRAQVAGIAIPRQVTLARRSDLHAVDVEYPVVIKPSRSVRERNGSRIKLGVQYAGDAAELELALGGLDSAAFPLLMQQRIVGPGVGVFLLVWDGQVVAQFSHRRIREKPPSGGVSVYRESIGADPDLVDRSRRLLASLDWNGVAMVEYKLDAQTGTPYLMEINGRFWGSLQLAIDAGVDFPNLLLKAAWGEKPEPVLSYQAGVRSRWWWGDVDQLLTRMRTPGRLLDLPPDDPGRLASLAQFLVLWRPGDRNEVLRLSDPRPFLRESLDWLQRR